MRLSRQLLCTSNYISKVADHILKPLMFPEWLEEKIQGVQIKWRFAKVDDFAEVSKACDAFYATDYVPAYFKKMVTQPNRRTLVLTTESGQFLSLCSSLVLNGGRTLYFSSGRTNEAFRFQRLLGLLSSRVFLRIAGEFPTLDNYLWLTRFDDQIFPPRYWPNRQSNQCTNRLLSALYILQTSVAIGDYDKVTRNFGQSLPSSLDVRTVKFEEIYDLVSRSGNASQLFVNGYVPIDSQVYPFHPDNFTSKNNLLGTQVYVSSFADDPAKIDGVTFCIANVCPVGLHLKLYHYSLSQSTMHGHVKYALERNAERLRALRQDEEALAPFRGLLRSHQFEPDRVFITVVSSIANHDPRELRGRLFNAGLQIGASGSKDIEFQYVCTDDAMTQALRDREPYFLDAIERERQYAAQSS